MIPPCIWISMYIIPSKFSRATPFPNPGRRAKKSPHLQLTSTTNILLDDSSISSSSKVYKAHINIPYSTPHHDLTSPQLINISKTKSAEQYQVTPNYLHSSVHIPIPQDSIDQGGNKWCRCWTCKWMHDICNYFQLSRKVVGIVYHVVLYQWIFHPDLQGCIWQSVAGDKETIPTRGPEGIVHFRETARR